MVSFVNINEVSFNSLKNRVLKFLRMGRSDVQTSVECAPYGTDSSPIKGMEAIYVKSSKAGKTVVIGYINKEQLADVGEHRTYSTDDDGALKFYIWQKKNGTCEIGGDADNMVRYSELETAFNELKSDFNTFVNTYNGHTHTGVMAGPGITGTTPAAGTTSNADISPAKIDEIKTL